MSAELATVERLLELIGTYGYPLVLSVVFLVFFLYMFKKQQKDIDKLVGSSKKEHPDEEDVNALETINEKIYREVRSIMVSTESDRAYVFLYHNGGVSHSGLFFQRMSCICEVVNSGVLPLSGEFQNLHQAAYSNVCNSLREKGCWYVEDVESLAKEDQFMYQTLRGRRVESSFVKALKDSRGGVIGFVGIDYCSLSHVPETDIIRSEIKVVASRLSSLVDLRGEVKG